MGACKRPSAVVSGCVPLYSLDEDGSRVGEVPSDEEGLDNREMRGGGISVRVD